MEYPSGEAYQKHMMTFNQDKAFVFQHVHRIVRCLIDCLTVRKDAVALKGALMLARSFSAKCWENSPNQLRQLPGVGPAAVKKFSVANIRTLEDLASIDAHKIEMIVVRNPPFGTGILRELRAIPSFSITLTQLSMVRLNETI